jgi:hypothetical protein
MTITSFATADAYLARKNDRPAPAPQNSSTRIVRDFVTPGSISVVYHRTPIVTYHANGMTELYAGGWATRTTAKKIETYAPSIGRMSPKRVAAPGTKNRSRITTTSGVALDPADRHGRGDCFVIYRPDHGGITHMLQTDAGQLSVYGALTVAPALRSLFPEYDCRCTMCRGGFETWQSAYAAGAWS